MLVIVNDYVAEDVSVDKMLISYVEKKDVEEVVNGLSTITDEAIGEVIKNNDVINLKNLLNSQKNIDEQLANSFDVKQELFIKARRQLEEIRLKLTIEAGNKLALKGFNIATEELSNVVRELTNIEQTYNNTEKRCKRCLKRKQISNPLK